MMAANSLHVAVHLIVSSGASSKWLLSCCRACRAGAFTPHFAQPSNVQTSCLDRVQPLAVDAFAGRLAASSTAPPGRRCQERQRGAKAEGKIKGRGTTLREKSVCTWGRRGTHLIAAPCRVVSQYLVGIELSACFSRLATLGLDGDAI
ncbi:hypothetical protein SAMN05216198_1593 [Halopseudomonas litoralis]|uniref:Uncharacterized protein n=1 Tax=Halopseudomonas litoralis TaxID=797277 RepID=A0A1H1QWH8_9GAMM|nr:hypothetical protein SAMN05216198_1593 [Halopseudomonas litoralis]